VPTCEDGCLLQCALYDEGISVRCDSISMVMLHPSIGFDGDNKTTAGAIFGIYVTSLGGYRV
jgi:hypothetical protein